MGKPGVYMLLHYSEQDTLEFRALNDFEEAAYVHSWSKDAVQILF